ncbi:MAG: DUF1559 domain-containing protein [candidate division WS1 bacterium]|jgi:prepilin-type N-terminal cleavage/methylation domain-containing protein|nr:DUF1559 domain-containing protein [candidate division WS1 bacterium]
MTQRNKKRGFTLVEMLVVIGIIVLLVAILVPVIQSARHKARMTQCQSQLQRIAQAMTEYKRQYHHFPPRPIYDATEEMYVGGISALFPKFISDYNDLICPDDRATFGRGEEARARVYSSYNGIIMMAEDASSATPWDFAVDDDTGNQKITYNWNGYDYMGWDRDTALTPPGDARPTWLTRGWRYYPRLQGVYAPEYTLITHCTSHRDFYSDGEAQIDTIVRVSSDVDQINVSLWQAQGADGSLFERQTN